jgi:predicted Zn-dependent peptidase
VGFFSSSERFALTARYHSVMTQAADTLTTFRKAVLPNGLTIIAEQNAVAHTAAVGFFVNTGTRDETRDVMGVSHFLEHMLFKGTARRTADDINREFDELGADYNAYTSHENTVYYAKVLPEYLEHVIDLLADMLRPALRSEDFDIEKNVILEEIGMYDDRPSWRLQDTIIETYFADHALGFRVLGTAASVTALTVDQMRAYFAERYGPENITVALAGKFDFDAVVKQLSASAGLWTRGSGARKFPPITPAITTQSIHDANLTRHYVGFICPGPSAQDPLQYAATVLADVVGDSEGSRLYWALIDQGLADEADISYVPQDRVGSFWGFASCDPKRAAKVEKILLKTIDSFAGSIRDDEVERAKHKLATSAVVSGENPSGRMRAMGGNWLYLQQYLTLDEELARLMAVTPADLQRVLERHAFSDRTLVRLGPKA